MHSLSVTAFRNRDKQFLAGHSHFSALPIPSISFPFAMMETETPNHNNHNGPNPFKRQRCVSPEHVTVTITISATKYPLTGDGAESGEETLELGGVEDARAVDPYDTDDEDAALMEDEQVDQVMALLDDLELDSLSKQAKFRSRKQTRQREEEKIRFAICWTLGMCIQSKLCGRTRDDRLDLIRRVRGLLQDADLMDLSPGQLLHRLGEVLLSRSSYFPPRFITLDWSCSTAAEAEAATATGTAMGEADCQFVSASPLQEHSTAEDDLESLRADVVSNGRCLLARLASKTQALLTERTILLSEKDGIAEGILEGRIQALEGMQEIAIVWIHALTSNAFTGTGTGISSPTMWRHDQLDIANDAFEATEEDLKGMFWNFAYFVSLSRAE
jgi:hypothetical protein